MTAALLAVGVVAGTAWWASVGDARREQGAMTRQILRDTEGVEWCGH